MKVESSGLSAAINASTNYLATPGNASIIGTKEKSKETRQVKKRTTSHACVVRYKRYPLKAFRIPRHGMKLTAEAIVEGKLVTNLSDAKKFLKKYGSHIPAGVHHLGGIFSEVIDVKVEEEINEQSLITAATNLFNAEVSVGGLLFSFDGAISGSLKVLNSKGETDRAQNKQETATYTKTIKCFGPNAANAEIFTNILEVNNTTWRVIDRGDLGIVVSIWELLRDLGDEYVKPAKLIKDAWQDSSDISESMQKVIESMRSSVSAKLKSNWKSNCAHIIADIHSSTQNLQEKVGGKCNITAEVLKMPEFIDFLRSVIHNDTLVAAQDLICRMLDADTFVSLTGTVTLDEDIEKFVVQRLSSIDRNAVSSQSETESATDGILLADIPKQLSLLSRELHKFKLDENRCKLKAAEILSTAQEKEDEQEMKSAVWEKAKEFGYQPERLCFSENFSLKNLPDLAESLNEILNIRFVKGDAVRFEFDTDKEELGWNKGNKHKIEVTGTVENVHGSFAFVKWEKMENITLRNKEQPVVFVRNEISQSLCSKWLGIHNDPESDNGVKYKMPFWKLKVGDKSSDDQQKPPNALRLQWRRRSNELTQTEQVARIHLRDFCVDRPPVEHNSSSVESIIDALRHRTNIFKTQETQEDSDDDTDCDDDWGTEEGVEDEKKDPFSALIQLLDDCNLSARQEVFRQLFDQRYSVPLIYISQNTKKLTYLLESLRFIEIKLQDQSLDLMTDILLPRVVFLSQVREDVSQSLHMTKEVFLCTIASTKCCDNLGLMAELAIGRLNRSGSDKCSPWLVLHVRGDFTRIWSFIEEFADIIVCQLAKGDDSNDKTGPKSSEVGKSLLKWKITDEKLKADYKKKTISGDFHQIAEKMKTVIKCISKRKRKRKEKRIPISDIAPANMQMIDQINGIDLLTTAIKKIDFTDIRRHLDMQKSFLRECEYRLEMQCIRGDPNKFTVFQRNIEKEIESRREKSLIQMFIPILKYFYSILQIKDEDLRVVALSQFEKSVNEKCSVVLKNEKHKVNEAWERYVELKGTPDADAASKEYYRAKVKYADKTLGFEHLWREIGHIYVARPSRWQELPGLAAQHLIDGFALEILDGDAGIVNLEWIKAVLFSVNTKLKENLGRDPIIFVLSVMGAQSTGKSVLLNTMFGCRLKVSAGQCTRGMNLQLVRAENRAGKFDYVLVIDTQGLRSPEFFGADDAIVRDNRLATYSILPADACIITAVNEDDSAIKEVLPIVMLAFKGSSIAEEINGRLRAMMFFVYSRVDTSRQSLDKFENNRHKLLMELQEAVSSLERHKIEGNESIGKDKRKLMDDEEVRAKEYDGLNKFIRHFRLSEDEEDSDVKYVGLLNKGDKPPDDGPNFDFGEKILKLREYTFERLSEVNYQNQTLTEWSEYFDSVSQCIDVTEFELNFKTVMEFQAFNDLKTKIDNARQAVCQKYCEQYGICEEEITSLQGKAPSLQDLKLKLHAEVQGVIVEQENLVRKLLTKDHFKQFKIEELTSWEKFVQNRKEEFSGMLTNFFRTHFEFKQKVEDYEKAMLEKLKDRYGQNPDALKDCTNRQSVFEEIFREQYIQALKDHPPMDVSGAIHKEYERHEHIKIDQTTLQSFSGQLGSQWKTVKGLLPWSTDKEETGFERVCNEVILKANLMLHPIRYYNAGVVQDIIQMTSNAIIENKIDNKGKQGVIHARIKYLLHERLTSLQEQWNMENNIPEKLKIAKPRLRNKFESICKEFTEVRTVSQDISDGIKEALSLGFIEHLALCTKDIVKEMSWMQSSVVMQAIIELHLLSLSKEAGIQELLQEIRSPHYHYDKLLSELIMKCVNECMNPQETWESLVTQICRDIPNAAMVASTSEVGRHKTFRSRVDTILDPLFKKHLPPQMWSDMNEVEKKLSKDNWREIADLIKEELDVSLSKEPKYGSELVSSVRDLLKREGFSVAASRCPALCPRCHMSCQLSYDHISDVGRRAKHDCKHQPAGIVGGYWVGGENDQELVNESCGESVKIGHHMCVAGTSVSYKNFKRVYLHWRLPKPHQIAKVRKYLFRQYQRELAEEYRRKQCSCITGHFDVGSLESELYQIIEQNSKESKSLKFLRNFLRNVLAFIDRAFPIFRRTDLNILNTGEVASSTGDFICQETVPCKNIHPKQCQHCDFSGN